MSSKKKYLPGPGYEKTAISEMLGVQGERITMAGLLRLLALQGQELPSRVLKEFVDLDPSSNAGRNMQGLLSEGSRRGFIAATVINSRMYMWYITEAGMEHLEKYKKILERHGWWIDEEGSETTEDGDSPGSGDEGVHVGAQDAHP